MAEKQFSAETRLDGSSFVHCEFCGTPVSGRDADCPRCHAHVATPPGQVSPVQSMYVDELAPIAVPVHQPTSTPVRARPAPAPVPHSRFQSFIATGREVVVDPKNRKEWLALFLFTIAAVIVCCIGYLYT